MNKLKKPIFKVREVADKCSSNLNDKAFKTNVQASLTALTIEESKYDNFALNDKISQIVPLDRIGSLTQDNMKKLYTNKLVKVKQPARDYYDKLMSSTSICPYCNTNVVSTLDHFLPKSEFVQYGITPVNLVPSCKDCNTGKGVINNNVIICHPYYEDNDDEIWLKCTILNNDLHCIKYSVIEPKKWTSAKCEKVKEQFRMFKLNQLYAVNAVERIKNETVAIEELLQRNKTELIKYLELKIRSYEANIRNSWEVALFRELLIYYSK